MNSEKNTQSHENNGNGSAIAAAEKAQLQLSEKARSAIHARIAQLEPTRLSKMMTVDPPARYGNGTQPDALYTIHVPTMCGTLWITHVGEEMPLDHHKDMKRPLAASNMKEAAGAWPKAIAELYLKEVRKMWITATIRRAE